MLFRIFIFLVGLVPTVAYASAHAVASKSPMVLNTVSSQWQPDQQPNVHVPSQDRMLAGAFGLGEVALGAFVLADVRPALILKYRDGYDVSAAGELQRYAADLLAFRVFLGGGLNIWRAALGDQERDRRFPKVAYKAIAVWEILMASVSALASLSHKGGAEGLVLPGCLALLSVHDWCLASNEHNMPPRNVSGFTIFQF